MSHICNLFVHIPGYAPSTSLWIGGNDLADAGRWVWSDGFPIKGYNNWATQEPKLAYADRHCMEVKFTQRSNGWWPAACNGLGKERAFIAVKGKHVMNPYF